MKKIYYHFTGENLRDGRPVPPPGVWLTHKGKVIPCESGYHASKHPFDALAYAPGCYLHQVVLRGKLHPHGQPVDKVAARSRKIVKSLDAEQLVRDFARRVALDAVVQYWPGAPKIVLEYLKTGDKTIRAAAGAAAGAATEDAAGAAMWAAAKYAAGAATWAAAWAATRAAAWAAMEDAAWAAAKYAAWAATEDAARAAAGAAAWAAAGTKYRQWFLEMVETEFAKGGPR